MLWLLILASLVAIVAAFVLYSGALSKPVFEEQTTSAGPYLFVYRLHVGPFKKVNKVFQQVSQALRKTNMTHIASLGMYFDDPHTMPAHTLRSHVGYVIQGNVRVVMCHPYERS